jgi:hypothetical protein
MAVTHNSGAFYNTNIVRNGLLVYLDAANPKSYAGSGITWYDLSGNNRNATLTNAPVHSGTYFTFDGVNQGATAPNTSYPAAWTDPFSIETWLRIPTAATWNTTYYSNIISRGTYGGAHALSSSSTNNRISGYIRGDAATASPYATILRDIWYNAVLTWDGTYGRIYINEILQQTSGSYSLTGVPENAEWFIATAKAFGGAIGSPFTGDMSMIKIYSVCLTQLEITKNFNAMRGRYSI